MVRPDQAQATPSGEPCRRGVQVSRSRVDHRMPIHQPESGQDVGVQLLQAGLGIDEPVDAIQCRGDRPSEPRRSLR